MLLLIHFPCLCECAKVITLAPEKLERASLTSNNLDAEIHRDNRRSTSMYELLERPFFEDDAGNDDSGNGGDAGMEEIMEPTVEVVEPEA